MRSNGQPVYNFCVTVDDATMAISHVIRWVLQPYTNSTYLLVRICVQHNSWYLNSRAEEHLPNTLRQALIYKVPWESIFVSIPLFIIQYSWIILSIKLYFLTRYMISVCMWIEQVNRDDYFFFFLFFFNGNQALGFPMPRFAHVSLILAPDRSKLSKRHGATSVGQVIQYWVLMNCLMNL